MSHLGFSMRRLLMGAALMGLLASGAHAQATSDLQSNAMLASVIDSILGKDLLNSFKAGAMGISGGFLGGAKIIAGILALASLMWNLLMAQTNREPAMPVVVETLLFAMVTAALLAMYSQIVDSVVSFGTWATAQAGGSLGTAVQALFKSIITAVITNLARIGDAAPTLSALFFNGGLGAIVDLIVSAIILLLAFVLMIFAIIELVGVVLLGPVIVGIAIALGPLFIATLASHWTRKWFDQWFNFFVNGAFLYAMTVVVVTLVSAAIGSLMNSNPGGVILSGQALGLAILAAGLGKIFGQIPALADGLLPGRAGARPESALKTAQEIGKAMAPAKAAQAATKAYLTPGAKAASSASAKGGQGTFAKGLAWLRKP